MAKGGNQQGVVENNRTLDVEATATTDLKSVEWRVIGETIQGASHLRDGKPNQDALLQVRESSFYPPIILSLSDGHGSNKCFRSHRGSWFAVTIGAGLMRQILNEKGKGRDASTIGGMATERFPIDFVRRWQEEVATDLRHEPFTKEELDQLEAKDGVRAREVIESLPSLAYGATALTVALTQSYIIYAQLGDGEIITVSETGEVSKPVPEDERLFANETTSLCTDTASQDFRIACLPLTQPPPALIVMTTDGYANSFADDASFLKVGSDLLTMLRTDGFDTVNRNVKEWLEEATRLGSGDDCTLGIICRMDTLQNFPNSPLAAVKEDAAQQSATQDAGGEPNHYADQESAEKS